MNTITELVKEQGITKQIFQMKEEMEICEYINRLNKLNRIIKRGMDKGIYMNKNVFMEKFKTVLIEFMNKYNIVLEGEDVKCDIHIAEMLQPTFTFMTDDNPWIYENCDVCEWAYNVDLILWN